jgi:hypothetical protein
VAAIFSYHSRSAEVLNGGSFPTLHLHYNSVSKKRWSDIEYGSALAWKVYESIVDDTL